MYSCATTPEDEDSMEMDESGTPRKVKLTVISILLLMKDLTNNIYRICLNGFC